MAYDKFDASDGVWRTIGGRRIFIKNKQPLSEAMKQSGKFKKASDITRNEYKNIEAELNKDTELLRDREADPVEEINRNDLEGKHIAKVEPTKEYTSNFLLEAEVNDFDKAQAYLTDDDMTQYVPEELKGVITKAEWTLDDESSGHVSIQTTRDLTDAEKKSLQSWIDGQNSDGLGEGFEQQQFAETYYDPYTGDGPYTYNEAESEISNRFDNMDPRDYSDYLDEALIDDAVDSYLEQNGYDYDDYEARETAREDILDDPESYLEWEAIDDAKNEAIKGDDYYNVDSWYNMSSIRRNGEGFEEKDLKPSKSSSDDYEYNLYKRAKEDPDSIDGMTEWSTNWEALDKKYKDRYDYEKKSIEANKPAGQKTSDLIKENNVKTFADEIKEKDILSKEEMAKANGIPIEKYDDTIIKSSGKVIKDQRYYDWVEKIDPNTNLSDKELEDIYKSTFPDRIEGTSNDWLRNAFNKYKQEHPNTKMSLEDFMKNYKK